MLMAVQTQYADEKRPIDLLICAGLPELMRGAKARTVLDCLVQFRDWAKSQNSDNSVAIASVPEAPTGSKDIIEEEFAKQTRELNEGILKMNDEMAAPYKSRAPRFHIWGTKKTAEDEEPRIGKSNNLYDEEPDIKVHHQLRMGKAMISFFRGAYGLIPRERGQVVRLSYAEARRKRNKKAAARKRRRRQL